MADAPQCRFRPSERWGIYVIVVLCLMQSCDNGDQLVQIKQRLEQMRTPTEEE